MALYVDLLRARNRLVNLVSRATVHRLVEKQIAPCLAGLLVIPPDRALRVLDVGTGGGLPGIPLKILRPSIRLDLLDATRKKCVFLEEAVARLELTDTRVHWGRVEQPGSELLGRSPFDLLLARAMGSPEALEHAAPGLLAPHGAAWRFVAPEGADGDLPWPPGPDPITALRRLPPR